METSFPPSSGFQFSADAAEALGQPPDVVSSWIDRLLGEDIAAATARLAQLREQFEARMLGWDNSALTRALQGAKEGAHAMDFPSLYSPGLLAVLLGRSAQSRDAFVTHYRKLTLAMDVLREQNQVLTRSYRTNSLEARHVLLELEQACRGFAALVQRGVAWLEQMSAEMARRDPAQAASDSALADLAAHAHGQAEQLKQFEAVSSAAAEVVQAGQGILARRAALLEMLRVDLDGYERLWLRRIGGLAQEASQSGRALNDVQGAEAVHRELMGRIDRSNAACVALQVEDQSLAHRLALLREQLQPFAGDTHPQG